MVQASPVSSCIRSFGSVACKRGTKKEKKRERERGEEEKKEETLSFRMKSQRKKSLDRIIRIAIWDVVCFSRETWCYFLDLELDIDLGDFGSS